MILKSDCKHFPGDKPCIYNKLNGQLCIDCNNYSPVKFKVLIIKLDAVGDVLRTTSILPSIKRKYPDAHITWLTKSLSKDLFKNNYLVDSLIYYEDHNLTARLNVEEFDLLINPDASPVSSAFASSAKSKVKKGFYLDAKGKVSPINPESIEWFEMGAFDQYKKNNKKTYQQIIHEIAGLEYKKDVIQLYLDEDEIEFRNNFAQKHKLYQYKTIVGINPGASKRWQLKKWRLDGYSELIEKLSKNKESAILLYGGTDETDSIEALKKISSNVISTGTNNSLRNYFALLDLSDVVITGDTLALHAAAALNKKVICLFGPTSSAEIEDYGLIKKIFPEMDCLVCYKQSCDFNPNCMDLIKTEVILNELNNLLEKHKN